MYATGKKELFKRASFEWLH